MFELCRKIVAGPKKKLQWNGKELDLTYVTDRIIAMAFPASGLESAYRNSIKDVSQFLHQKHGSNFMIINVSARKYDYKFFNNNVLDYEWRDHLSPPLSTLWQIGREMYEYLRKNKNNVVAVHCNHGKGRTGTTIIAFLMFIGFFEKFDQALTFYNMRRFASLDYGVSQPCQKRYLNYFEILRNKLSISPRLVSYKVNRIRQKGLPNQKYFLEISSIRQYKLKYKKLLFCENTKKIYPKIPLMGDICIQLYQDKWNGDQQIAMINCHTFFFDGYQGLSKMEQKFSKNLLKNNRVSTEKSMSTFSISTIKQQKFYGRNIKINGKHTSDFQITIDFEWYCYCHFQMFDKPNCLCKPERVIEQKQWKKTLQCVQISKNLSKIEACSLISTIQYLHQENWVQQTTEGQKKLLGANNLKNCSKESNQNTQSSLGAQKSYYKQSLNYQKEQKQMQIMNGLHDDSMTNKTEELYEKDKLQQDMAIVNRNSTNSV